MLRFDPDRLNSALSEPATVLTGSRFEVCDKRREHREMSALLPPFLTISERRCQRSFNVRSADGYRSIPLVLLTSEHPLLSVLGQQRAEKSLRKLTACFY